MVPDSEWRIPTLIGPVSETFAAGAGAAAAADVAGAALVAAAGAPSPGPLQPNVAKSPAASTRSIRVFITISNRKRVPEHLGGAGSTRHPCNRRSYVSATSRNRDHLVSSF